MFILCVFGLFFEATFWWAAVPLGLVASFLIILAAAAIYDQSPVFRSVRNRRLFQQHDPATATSLLVLSLIKQHRKYLMHGFLWKEATKPAEWEAIKRKFYQDRIAPALLIDPRAAADYDEEKFVQSADFFLRDLSGMAQPSGASLPNREEPRPLLTAVGFEKECAAVLRSCGWITSSTAASGDQGADVVADKNGVRFVFQCKLYGRPVGNKAVQEAYAAKAFYGASRAAVISNSGYTASARDLAASTGVLLLTPADLSGLDVRAA